MRSVEIEKRQSRRVVADHAGQNLDHARPWEAAQRQAELLAEVYRLPVDADDVIDLNTADGSLVFIPGISDPGGTDVLV